MKLSNIGFIYKGKKIVNIQEIHVTAARPNAVTVIYDKNNVIKGEIKDFTVFDKDDTDSR